MAAADRMMRQTKDQIIVGRDTVRSDEGQNLDDEQQIDSTALDGSAANREGTEQFPA